MNVTKRNNVTIKGNGSQVIMFAHGFGCDQNMWRYVSPAFEKDHQVVLFDHVGAGGSELAAYSVDKYKDLEGYSYDIIEMADELQLSDIIFVGHSVSAMIGVIAAGKAPHLFKSLILVGPSPCYVDTDDYTGGFTKPQIEELLESLNENHLGWSMTMAPAIMGNADRKELGEELANSFCKTDPAIARHFARTTFLSDTRTELSSIKIPTLILQCSEDIIAPESVGKYVQEQIPGSKLVIMNATGHCPNLSAPAETIQAIKDFLNE